MKEADQVKVGIIVTTDTQTAETDRSGLLLESVLGKSGYKVLGKQLCRNDTGVIESMVNRLATEADVIILTGGTGISKKDHTVDALLPMFEKDLPGFGERMRVLGLEQVGERALLSRSCGGVVSQTLVFCIPGSMSAAETALKILVPMLKHAVYELKFK